MTRQGYRTLGYRTLVYVNGIMWPVNLSGSWDSVGSAELVGVVVPLLVVGLYCLGRGEFSRG